MAHARRAPPPQTTISRSVTGAASLAPAPRVDGPLDAGARGAAAVGFASPPGRPRGPRGAGGGGGAL
jgi:hypothetical protein